ncbi:response regulator [Thermanaerosceptrum fracticalcis]|uniref:response regulator n=1 Tax=Thermanaerosceptrum fracticalcis TaxID=1712410 RepID=UPI001FAE4B7D|nr:response regulator [Thermanaerosceptrum fracticalcis]
MGDAAVKRILIVDDNKFDAAVTSDILKKHGYDTKIVRSGEEALEKMNSYQELYYDLILMDIELGKGMDGMEAAAEIQQCCGIPVVFLFAHTEGNLLKKSVLLQNMVLWRKTPVNIF